MTVETILLIFAIVLLVLLLIYEVFFVLCVKDITANKVEMKTETDGVDVIVQPRPLGYSEPPSIKIQQCNTPVFELPEVPMSEAPVCEDEAKPVPVEVQSIRKNSGGKPPVIVVSSPTPTF
jgi:hypothetical protein